MTLEQLLNDVAQAIMPLAVAAIMFCLGLGLERADFSRVFQRPRLMATALPCPLLLLPLIALALSKALALGPELTAGLEPISKRSPGK